MPTGPLDLLSSQERLALIAMLYAELHTGNECHLVRESLSSLEDRLDPEHFIRVHRSFIVRLECIDTILRGERRDYHIQLKSGARLPMSRDRREDVKLRLSNSG